MRVYISGPITGTTDYKERFQRAEDMLRARGDIPVNPAKILSVLPEETHYDFYMAVALKLLELCDGIYVMKGWKDSRGALAELCMADVLGKHVEIEDND